jgi:vanillate/4-hydroxybenzoate decarboxylase subunit D
VSAFARPQELFVHQEREPVAGVCPECGAQDLKKYPVLSENGWEIATKCQACLCSVERTKWNRLGPITPLGEMVA